MWWLGQIGVDVLGVGSVCDVGAGALLSLHLVGGRRQCITNTFVLLCTPPLVHADAGEAFCDVVGPHEEPGEQLVMGGEEG